MRNLFCWDLSSWRRAAQLVALVKATAAGGVCVLGQTSDANRRRAPAPPPPYSLFQYSTLTGSGRTIVATRVPVVLTNGSIIYKNLTLLVDVDSMGASNRRAWLSTGRALTGAACNRLPSGHICGAEQRTFWTGSHYGERTGCNFGRSYRVVARRNDRCRGVHVPE